MPSSRTAPAGRREQRRLAHQDLSRSQLLDAAEDVFGTKGYHGTTLKEVAELAGWSVGSVYSFFANKDDLFRQIFVRHGELLMPEVRRICGPGGDPVARLRELVAVSVRYFRANPAFGRLFLRYFSMSLPADEQLLGPLVAASYDDALDVQAEFVARGQDAGVFVPGPPRTLARLVSAMITGYQATDPAVVGDDPEVRAAYTLEDLQDLVTRAVVIGGKSHANS